MRTRTKRKMLIESMTKFAAEEESGRGDTPSSAVVPATTAPSTPLSISKTSSPRPKMGRTISSKQWRNAVSVQALCRSLREGQAEISALQITLGQAQKENNELLERLRDATTEFRNDLDKQTSRAEKAEGEVERLSEENEVLKAKIREHEINFEKGETQSKRQLDCISRTEEKYSNVLQSRELLKVRCLRDMSSKKVEHVLRAAMRGWTTVVTRQIHQKRFLRMHTFKMEKTRLLQGLHHWKHNAHKLTIARNAIIRLLGRKDTRTMGGAFREWKSRARNVRLFSTALHRLEHRNKRFDLFLAFRALLAHMHYKRVQEASMLPAGSRDSWMRNHKKLAARMLNKVFGHWRHVHLRRGFNSWHVSLHKDRHRCHVVRLVMNKSLRRELFLGFKRWKEVAIDWGHKHDVLERTSKRMSRRNQLRAWHSWRFFVERKRAMEGVLNHVVVPNRAVTHALFGRLIRISRRCRLLHGMVRWLAHARLLTEEALRKTADSKAKLQIDRSVDREAVEALHHQREWLARKHLMTISKHTNHRTLIVCFRSWAALTKLKTHKRQAFGMAAKHWLNARLAKSFESWKLMHQRRKHKKRILLKYADHMTHIVLHIGWNTWRAGIARYNHQHQVMGHIMKRLMHRRLYRTFRGWHRNASERRRCREIVVRCFERGVHQSLFAAMNKWVEIAQRRKRVGMTLARASARWHHMLLLRSWNKLHACLLVNDHDKRLELARESHRNERDSQRMILLRRLVMHMTHVSQSRAWASWIQHVQRKSHRSQAVRCMLMRWTRRNLELGFKTWCHHTHIHRHNELAAYCDELHAKIESDHKAFKDHHATNYRRQIAEKVVERLRHSRLWRFFHSWVVFHQHERKTRQLLMKCRQHMLHRRTLRAWNSWLAYCARRARARRFLRRFVAGWGHRDLMRAFHNMQTGIIIQARIADQLAAKREAEDIQRDSEERLKETFETHHTKRRQMASIAGRILGKHLNRHDMKLTVFYAFDRNRHDRRTARRVLSQLALSKCRVNISRAFKRWQSFRVGHEKSSNMFGRIQLAVLRRAPLRSAMRRWREFAHQVEIARHEASSRRSAAAVLVRASKRIERVPLYKAWRKWCEEGIATTSELYMLRWIQRHASLISETFALESFSSSSRQLFAAVSSSMPRLVGANRCALFLLDDFGASLRSVVPARTAEAGEKCEEIRVILNGGETLGEEVTTGERRQSEVERVARTGRKSITVVSVQNSKESNIDLWAYRATGSGNAGEADVSNVPSGRICAVHAPVTCGSHSRVVGVLQVLLSPKNHLTARHEILIELSCHFVGCALTSNLLRTELFDSKDQLNKIRLKHDALAASAEDRERVLKSNQAQMERMEEDRVALEELKALLTKTEIALAEKEEEICAVRDELENVTENNATISELEQERLLLAVDVSNLRNQLARAEADNLFLGGTMRKVRELMRRRNLTMRNIGVSTEHMQEILRICKRIEEAERREKDAIEAEDSILFQNSSDSDLHILGSPRSLHRARGPGGGRRGGFKSEEAGSRRGA
eukprot:g804.t1